jgi:hypothetical protein
MKRLSMIACALALTGCSAMISHEPPPSDWPALKIVYHHVPSAEMRDVCGQYVPWYALGMVEACAAWHFRTGECHVWFSSDLPPSGFVVEHEILHCLGHDHPGDTTAQRAWENYKRENGIPTPVTSGERWVREKPL